MALIKHGSVKCYLHHQSPSLHYTGARTEHSGQSSAPRYTGHKRAKARDSSWTFDNVSICCGCHSGWGWGQDRGNTATLLTVENHTASSAQKWKEHSPSEDRLECLTFRKMGHKLSQAPVLTKNPVFLPSKCVFWVHLHCGRVRRYKTAPLCVLCLTKVRAITDIFRVISEILQNKKRSVIVLVTLTVSPVELLKVKHQKYWLETFVMPFYCV